MSSKARCGVAIFVLAVCIALLVAGRLIKTPLQVVSSGSTTRVVSVACTFGTNHEYFYGGFGYKAVDSIARVLEKIRNLPVNADAHRLRSSTLKTSTVVWVRFQSPSFGLALGRVVPSPLAGMGPVFQSGPVPVRFLAQLKDIHGVVTTLADSDSRCQDFKHQTYITGWTVPGSLQSGSTIRIESTNGDEVVTFRVP
jgi:hypothetical protein